MKPVERQKICPNCDGRIPFDASQCTYCFTPVQVDKLSSSSQDNLNALYTPPYSSRPAEPIAPHTTAETAVIQSETKSFWPLLLLTLGGNLLTLAILQFFFSNHGVIQLEINGSYWFLMLLAALPLLYLGFKNTKS